MRKFKELKMGERFLSESGQTLMKMEVVTFIRKTETICLNAVYISGPLEGMTCNYAADAEIKYEVKR